MAFLLFMTAFSTIADPPPDPCDCADDEYVDPNCVGVVACYSTDDSPISGQSCCIYDPSNRVPINGGGIWIIAAGFVLGLGYFFVKNKRLRSN